MTLSELLTLSRRQLDDPIEVDDTDALWSTAELTQYINQAVKEACFRVDLIIDENTASVCNVSVVDGTSDYALSPKILQIERVVYGDDKKVLSRVGHRNMDRKSKEWETEEGEPQNYLLDTQQRSIKLYPIPEADTTMYFVVSRLPLVDLSADDDSPEIPEQYHYDLVYWVKKLALEKLDSEAHNLQASQMAEQIFNDRFGQRKDALWLEHKLTRRKYTSRGHYF